jgi:ribosome-associated translation inhibitor RaiA
MEIRIIKTFTLNEKEIREAIRKHLVDKLGTSMEIKERNIELHASVSASETPYGFTATFTITDATQA